MRGTNSKIKNNLPKNYIFRTMMRCNEVEKSKPHKSTTKTYTKSTDRRVTAFFQGQKGKKILIRIFPL